jgi:hypothetical protein
MKYLLYCAVLLFWPMLSDAYPYPQIGSEACNNPKFSENWADNYHMLNDENQTPFVGAASWYYDPDTPGVGLSVTVQQSDHSTTGYFAFGVFYTYKEDGSQAWYAIDGFYEPTTPDGGECWQKDSEDFGMHYKRGGVIYNADYVLAKCWWGDDETYLGELDSVMIETANGNVLDGEYSPHDIVDARDVTVRWINPDQVEIYLDDQSAPAHTFERHKFSAGDPVSHADFLTQNTYFYENMSYGVVYKDYLPCNGECYHAIWASPIKGTLSFRKFDPLSEYTNPHPAWDNDYDSAVDHFKRLTSWKEHIQYYISNDCIEKHSFAELRTPLNPENYVASYETFTPNGCLYVVLAYDTQTQWLEGFLFAGLFGGDDISLGLRNASGGYTFRAPLPAADDAIISLFAGTYNGSNNNDSTRSFLMYRSSLTLYKIPSLGGLFEQMPAHFSPDWNIPVDSE